MSTLLVVAFLLLQCLCQVLATVECGGELPSGYVKYPGENTANKVYTDIVTWNVARDRCTAEGADLAIATTPEKIRHLQNRGENRMWIGIHRPSGIVGGDWVRIDTGLPVTTSSLPWKHASNYDRYDCVMTYDIGTITDSVCTYTWAFACEISLAEGCPDPAGSPGPQ